jgi:hypothetical protein
MNRRSFLKNFGIATGAITIAPYISFTPIPKRLVHKVELPTFLIFYTDPSGLNTIVGCTQTYKGTLKELCDTYPNDDIFFYNEGKHVIGDKFVHYTRAFVLKKERNIKVIFKPTYEV